MRRQVAGAAGNPAYERAPACGQRQFGTDRIAIALRVLELNANPLFLMPEIIVQKQRCVVQAREHDVGATVVIVIADRQPAPR